MIEIEDLEYRYRSGAFRLRIPRWSVADGEAVALVGPSGTGKTTLLNLIAGILPIDAGSLRVDDEAIHALGDAGRRHLRLDRIGLAFQEFELLEYLTVEENVLLPYRLSDRLRLDASVRQRARRLVDWVGLGDKGRRLVGRLSQGERQRVSLCRSLITEPSLVLADEPTGNLDLANRDRVLELLLDDARRRGTTLLVVTHDRDLSTRLDHVVAMDEIVSAEAAER